MTISAMFLALWAVLKIAPDTPTGRFLDRWMIGFPISILNRATRAHLMLILLLIGLGAALAWFGGADGFRFFGMAAPDVTVWFTTFEIGAYLDAIAGIAATASVLRMPAIRLRIHAAVGALFRRPARSGRQRTIRPPAHRSAANDDDGDRGVALAA